MHKLNELVEQFTEFCRNLSSRAANSARDLYSHREEIPIDRWKDAGIRAFSDLREKVGSAVAGIRSRSRELPAQIKIPGQKPTAPAQPSPPPVSESPEFIEWMLRHDEQLQPVRNLVGPDRLDQLVAYLARALLKELQTHRDREALAALLADAEKTFLDLEATAHEKGGIRYCTKEAQGNYLLARARLVILPYFQKYMYKDPEFFNKMGLRDL